MKYLKPMLLSMLLITSGITHSTDTRAEEDQQGHKVHHLVIVWLKQAGDEQIRQQYINESKNLSRLPGVLTYEIGSPANITRGHANPALDESYDLAVSSSYESREAYEEFLKNPEYLRVAQQELKPLVDRYKVYDFSE